VTSGVIPSPAEGEESRGKFDGDPSPSPRLGMTLAALLVAIGAWMLAQSWQRWLDPIIDAGRDLYIAGRLPHLELYRDFRYNYPPLVPYLLSLFTRIAGQSLLSFTIIAIVQSIGVAALLWLIGRRAAGVYGAFAAALLFLAFDFTGASTWGANFLFPYTYSATFGMLFLLGFLAGAVYERMPLALTSALLASWCKVEYAVAVGIAFLALLLMRRIRGREAIAFVIAWLASLALVAAYFRDADWLGNIFNVALTEGPRAKRFFAVVSGRADWQESIVESLLGIAGIAAIVFALRFIRSRAAAVVVVAIIAAVMHPSIFFRAWGVLQWVALLWAIVKDRRGLLAVFAVFSIVATLRIPLNVSPTWYGFVLILPVYALIVYVLFEYLPSRGAYAREAAILWLVVIAIDCGREIWTQRERYAAKSDKIVTMRGTFYDANHDRAWVLTHALPYLRGESLVVLPEGITLNYLADTPTTLTVHTFTPVETAYPAIENEILGEMVKNAPRHIAIVSRDVREYGSRGFGVDYDQRLAAWIRENYELEREWHEPRFALVLLRKADVSSAPRRADETSALPTKRGDTPLPDSPSPRTPAPTPN